MKAFLLIISMFGHSVPIAGGSSEHACRALRDDLLHRYRVANPGAQSPQMECTRGKP